MGSLDCLVPDCGMESEVRGLCMRHYSYARYSIRMGRTSWPELEAQGKVLASRQGQVAGGSSRAYFFGAEAGEN